MLSYFNCASSVTSEFTSTLCNSIDCSPPGCSVHRILPAWPSSPCLHIFPDLLKNNPWLGFPDGSVVKTLPASAGVMDLSPDPGRSHMPRSNKAHEPQLPRLLYSLGATTPEARVPKVHARQQEKPLQSEVHEPQRETSHHSLQSEKAHATMKTQHSHK